MELAFASLHQLCAPLLDRLGRLPAPQRDALRIVFGLTAGPPPDRFLVGLAVLNLVSEAAEERPLVLVIDDAHWLDHASSQTLGFVARRLRAEPVVAAVRRTRAGDELRGLPELEVGGLRDGDARALLSANGRFVLDARVRDRIVAETRGNPLALLELPRGLTPTQLAGGFGLPGAPALSGADRGDLPRRLAELPAETQRWLLVAAAEPVGDPLLVCARGRAARPRRLGGGRRRDGRAADDRRMGDVPPSARALGRLPVGLAAGAPGRAPRAGRGDRSGARPGPARLASRRRGAGPGRGGRAGARTLGRAGAGARGLAAAAAFLQRSVALTRDPARRADRALAAAQANLHAGAFDAALKLLAAAEAGALDELPRARAELLRGQIAFASGVGSDAPPLLLAAAQRLEPLDPASRARPTSTRGAPRSSPAGWPPPAACSRSRRPPGPPRGQPTPRARPTCCSTASLR